MSYGLLLVFLSSLMLLAPVLAEAGGSFWISYVITPAVLLSATWAASQSRLLAGIAVALLLLNLGLEVAGRVWPVEPLALAERAAGGSVFLFTSGVLLAHIMTRPVVTRDTILGGICVYLLFGVCFYYLFCMVELWSPGSFARAGEPLVASGDVASGRFSHLIYFSFVTLTTLGYGDVTPVHPLAHSLATLEAVVGQLYLTILIASLVGMRLAHARSDPKDTR